MKGINYGRVVLGGIVAGVVANACDYVIGAYIMTADMQRTAQRLNLDPDRLVSNATMTTWMVIDFIYGLLIVWTYAAIRPRLGPGPATAVCAGVVLYMAITVVVFGFAQMGIFTMDSFIKNAALAFGTAVLASLAGGAVYKEG